MHFAPDINYVPLHNYFADVDFCRPKKEHPNRYDVSNSNRKYCRKQCKFFFTNECFKKTTDEQMQCECYRGGK